MLGTSEITSTIAYERFVKYLIENMFLWWPILSVDNFKIKLYPTGVFCWKMIVALFSTIKSTTNYTCITTHFPEIISSIKTTQKNK